MLEWFYKLEIPPDLPFATKTPVQLRRRDLLTLLNNWPGEVDKARRQKDMESSMSRWGAILDTPRRTGDEVESFKDAR